MKLNAERLLNALLWRCGSGTVTFECNDEGYMTMHVEHAEAQDEFFMADTAEAVLDLAASADRESKKK